jgi:hypothetical protein
MQFLQGTTSLMAAEAGGVAWWAHIGGFGAGYLIAGALGHSPVCRPPNPARRVYESQPSIAEFHSPRCAAGNGRIAPPRCRAFTGTCKPGSGPRSPDSSAPRSSAP